MKPVPVLDHGFIELIDHMGSDLDIYNNAQASFNRSVTVEQYADDVDGTLAQRVEGVIRFMMREHHGSPFERPVFTFRVKAPIFVMREWHRHRHASLNEESMRYSVADAEFYVPDRDQIRQQVGKPGAYTFERIESDEQAEDVMGRIDDAQRDAFDAYRLMVNRGIAKEVARVVLPVGTYSTMIWQANFRSILNFLSLRNQDQAQWEIRQYAREMETIVTYKLPAAMSAFNDFGRMVP